MTIENSRSEYSRVRGQRPRTKRSRRLTRQVRQAYSQPMLTRICTMPEQEFGEAFKMETVEVSPWRSAYPRSVPEDYYHFRDNGASVLAVAHLDTVVHPERRVPRFRNTQRGPMITSGALDDRLGAYVILDLLPRMGVINDWLLTVGEESGMSTAEYFKPPKNYDWVIEFDRAGTDVVMYQYEDYDTCTAVEDCGVRVGSGSFSDIAYLEHLGVKAFNWGVGYRGNYHSEAGYAYLEDTFYMVGRYLEFNAQNQGMAMLHEPDRRYDREHFYNCNVCLGKDSVDSVTWYCLQCGACQDCYEPEDTCMCYVPYSAGKSDEAFAAIRETQ